MYSFIVNDDMMLDMFEGVPKGVSEPIFEEESEKSKIDKLDRSISDTLDKLTAEGLNMKAWQDEYESLPDDLALFEDFASRLADFQEGREDALASFDFSREGLSEENKAELRQFDREVMRAFKDHENFLGNGATAEVYGMQDNNELCIKFIIDQDAYNQNNHLRTEFDYLDKVSKHTATRQSLVVRVPYPWFLRIHAKEGHSYGMEKIPGASLSQILEFPDKYSHLIDLAQGLDREALIEQLVQFVEEMHACGVTHGDLYKRNLMLSDEGKLVVIDFGKAKTIEFAGDKEPERTSDIYNAKQSLVSFFQEIDKLTKQQD